MKLKSVALKNFRCFTNEVIEFDDYTALVGANNAGKSAIIAAIDIFFRSTPKSIPISADDFFKRFLDRDLEIQLTFSELSDDAQQDFEHYARGGELTFFIKSSFQEGAIQSSLHGSRLANKDFAPFFEMSTAAEKKNFYQALPDAYKSKLAGWQNQSQAADALREFEAANGDLNELIPSDDKAFGVEGPVPRLRKYIDFVYIPAVKDAGDEAIEARNTAFTRLIDRAVRANLKIDERLEKIRSDAKTEIDSISAEHGEILGALASRIEGEYRKFNSSESKIHLEWGSFEGKNLQISLPLVRLEVSDDLIKNQISKFGHGTQRNYLMALLMVSATYDFTSQQAIIIGCEEPELYQHPPQARLLARAILKLASSQTQIVVTTHSPYFINAKSFEKVRLVKRLVGDRSQVYQWSVDENRALIAEAKGEVAIGQDAARAMLNQFLQPQMNEMFFAPALILVEGDEDRALLTRYLELTGDYQRLLAAGVHIVPINGKGNFVNALSIARGFQIPYYAIFDGDMDTSDNKAVNIELNRCILSILGVAGATGDIAVDTIEQNYCAWRNCIQSSFEQGIWEAEKVALAAEFGWQLKRLRKNPILLEGALERLMAKKPSVPHLESLSKMLLSRFCKLS